MNTTNPVREHDWYPTSNELAELHLVIWKLIQVADREKVATFLEYLPHHIRKGCFDDKPLG